MKKIKSWRLFESFDDILPVGTKIKFVGRDCQIVLHKATHHNDIYYLVRYLDGQEDWIVPRDKRIEVI